jgi:hypothetical protein
MLLSFQWLRRDCCAYMIYIEDKKRARDKFFFDYAFPGREETTGYIPWLFKSVSTVLLLSAFHKDPHVIGFISQYYQSTSCRSTSVVPRRQ